MKQLWNLDEVEEVGTGAGTGTEKAEAEKVGEVEVKKVPFPIFSL